MINQYYQVLDLKENSGIKDIKRAYRNKAKKLHPDINPNPDAHEQFILINEAYEYLVNLKTGKVNASSSTSTTPDEYDFQQSWHDYEREAARARAQEYANMKYEAFKKTRQYKSAMTLNRIVDAIGLVLVLFIFCAPIIGFFIHGSWGLIGGLLVIFVTVHYWVDIFRQQKVKHNFKKVWDATFQKS